MQLLQLNLQVPDKWTQYFLAWRPWNVKPYLKRQQREKAKQEQDEQKAERKRRRQEEKEERAANKRVTRKRSPVDYQDTTFVEGVRRGQTNVEICHGQRRAAKAD